MIEDLARHPAVAIWETTRACDLACLHCRASAVSQRAPDELSTAEAYDLLDQLVDLGPRVLVLTGGDPLKRPDLLAIVEAATARGLHVALAPSVTPLLTAEAIARVARAGRTPPATTAFAACPARSRPRCVRSDTSGTRTSRCRSTRA